MPSRGERKIYLDLQELEARHLLKTTPTAMQIVQADGSIVTRVVTLKDFSGGCVKCSGVVSCQASEHDANHGRVDPALLTFRQVFIVLAQPT